MPTRKPNALLVGHHRLTVNHPPLHFGGATDRIDHARKFRQQPIAGGLDDPPVVLGDLRVDQLPAMRLEAFERAFLVRTHQPRIAHHVGGEDRGETAGGGHYSSGIPAFRKPVK